MEKVLIYVVFLFLQMVIITFYRKAECYQI